MGVIADTLINGEACAWCGVWLNPREKVYRISDDKKVSMPANGQGYGQEVVCKSCH